MRTLRLTVVSEKHTLFILIISCIHHNLLLKGEFKECFKETYCAAKNMQN